MSVPIKRGDFVLLSVLGVALAVGLFRLGTSYANGRKASANGMLVVTQTKDGFRRVDPLDTDAEYTVETSGTGSGADADGGLNTVRIRDGKVRVVSANCANQVCVEHDPVGEEGGQIVCLPHGMVVEVVADESDATSLR